MGYKDTVHPLNASRNPTMSSLREVVDILLRYMEQNLLDESISTEYTSHVPNLSTTAQDMQEKSSDSQDPTFFLFVFYTLVMGPVCLMGLVGNTVSIHVLSKDRNHRVVTFLLKCLAMADNLVLLVSFVTLSMIYGLLHYVKGMAFLLSTRPYVVKFVHPIGYISQTLTIWLTVLLAINRYIAICRPFDVHKFCTIRKAQLQVLACVVLTIIINFPRFFQYNIVTVTENNTTYVTVNDSDTIGESTLFGKIYTNALFTIIVLVLPLLLILIVNSKLIIELQSMRRRISRASGYNVDKNGDGEKNITMVMIIIIVVLLVCHTPDRVAQLLRVTVSAENREYPKFTFFFTNISNFLIVLNSSTNFFIYYFLRRRFRQIFKAAFNFGCRQIPISEDDKGLSVQSTPLTEQNVANTIVKNDAHIKMIENGKGI